MAEQPDAVEAILRRASRGRVAPGQPGAGDVLSGLTVKEACGAKRKRRLDVRECLRFAAWASSQEPLSPRSGGKDGLRRCRARLGKGPA